MDPAGAGFDAALRVAGPPDLALVSRRGMPVAAPVVASPADLACHCRPSHPDDLDPGHCLGDAYRALRGVRHFDGPGGAHATIVPSGRVCVTNADAPMAAMKSGRSTASAAPSGQTSSPPSTSPTGGALSFVTRSESGAACEWRGP